MKSRRFDEPTFVFDLAGDKKHRCPDRGLDAFGPFDSEGFTPKRPSIAVVTPSSLKGTVETFISSFPGRGAGDDHIECALRWASTITPT